MRFVILSCKSLSKAKLETLNTNETRVLLFSNIRSDWSSTGNSLREKKSQSYGFFRLASVSSTYPCQSVCKSVRRYFPKVYFFKVYFCEMYLICVSFFRCSLPKAMSISRSELLRKKKRGDRKFKFALGKGS